VTGWEVEIWSWFSFEQWVAHAQVLSVALVVSCVPFELLDAAVNSLGCLVSDNSIAVALVSVVHIEEANVVSVLEVGVVQNASVSTVNWIFGLSKDKALEMINPEVVQEIGLISDPSQAQEVV
jgi:hypothetical protein